MYYKKLKRCTILYLSLKYVFISDNTNFSALLCVKDTHDSLKVDYEIFLGKVPNYLSCFLYTAEQEIIGFGQQLFN